MPAPANLRGCDEGSLVDPGIGAALQRGFFIFRQRDRSHVCFLREEHQARIPIKASRRVRRSLTGGDAHLRPRQPRVRAGRRRVAGGDQWRPLPGFRQRRCRQRAGPRAPKAGRCADPAGQQGVAHLQPLSRRRPGAAGGAAVRGDVRRPGVLLQFGRGGLRRRHQAGAALSLRERPARTLAADYVQGRIPRAHARHHRLGGQCQAPGRLRRSGRRVRHRPVRRSRGGGKSHRPANGRHHGRAGAGRGRRQRRVPRLAQGAARAVRQARTAARARRGADRHGPHRQAVRARMGRLHAGRDGGGQGARRRVPDRGGAGDRRGRQGHGRRHPRLDLRRQSARQRPSARPCWRPCWSLAFSSTCRP